MHAAHSIQAPHHQVAELEEWILETPKDATVKGMFIDSFLKAMDRERLERPTSKRYVAFRDYPLTELMRMMVDSTAILHPRLPPKEGLRLLGQLVYPTLVDSTVGKVIFAIAGRSWEAALPLAKRAWEISLSPASAELVDLKEGSATLRLRDIWNFADCYQVGVMQGAMDTFQVQGTVTAKRYPRRCDVDLLLEWEPA